MIDFTVHTNKLIKKILSGLNGFSRLVIYEALEYCDYEKGVIFLPTFHEFAHDFYVERAPGRKREVINERTIRNAFRTIKKFKSDFFKFRTVNQRVEIEIPALKELYDSGC